MRTRRDPDTALPEPDADARAHAARVRAAIVAALDARGGFMPVREYVELALHAPGLGYYAAGARKFGAAGDFTTAPEMTPLFGAALASQVARILEATGAREIVELGAGSGRLAIHPRDRHRVAAPRLAAQTPGRPIDPRPERT